MNYGSANARGSPSWKEQFFFFSTFTSGPCIEAQRKREEREGGKGRGFSTGKEHCPPPFFLWGGERVCLRKDIREGEDWVRVWGLGFRVKV